LNGGLVLQRIIFQSLKMLERNDLALSNLNSFVERLIKQT